MKKTYKDILRRPEIAFIVILVIIFAFHLCKGGGEMSYRYLDLSHAIANDGELSIDKYSGNTGDVAYFENRTYSASAPGLSFVSVVPLYIVNVIYDTFQLDDLSISKKLDTKIRENYIENGYDEDNNFLELDLFRFTLGNFVIVLLTSYVVSILFGLLLYKYLNMLYKNKRINFIVAIITIFGTIIFTYTVNYHAHLSSMFLALLSLFLVERYKNKWVHLLAGFTLALSFVFHYSMLLILSVLFVFYVFRNYTNKDKILFYLIGGIIPIIVLVSYHSICFDSPFSTPYDYLQPGVRQGQEMGYNGLTFPSVTASINILFSLYRGFFIYMPVFFLVLYLVIFKQKVLNASKNKHHIYLIYAIFLVTLLFNASYSKWHGDWSFGPRHMFPAIPFLAMLLPMCWDVISKRFIYFFISISIFINWLGANYGVSPTSIKNPIFDLYIPHLIDFFNLRTFVYAGKLFNLSNNTVSIISIIFVPIILVITYIIYRQVEFK